DGRARAWATGSRADAAPGQVPPDGPRVDGPGRAGRPNEPRPAARQRPMDTPPGPVVSGRSCVPDGAPLPGAPRPVRRRRADAGPVGAGPGVADAGPRAGPGLLAAGPGLAAGRAVVDTADSPRRPAPQRRRPVRGGPVAAPTRPHGSVPAARRPPLHARP